MRKTLRAVIASCLLFCCGTAFAAHTFDTSAQIAAGTSNPQAANYTCGAGATVIVATLIYADGTRTGAPTYNGVALTQADQTRKHSSSPEAVAELWYLLNPPTGSAYSLSVPNPNGLLLEVVISSYKAAAGNASVLHMATGGNGSSANPSLSLTTTATSVIVAVVAHGADTFAPSARSGTSLYETDNGTWGGGHQYHLQAGAGTKAMSWTQGADDWGAVAAAFMEVPTGINVSKAGILGVLAPATGINVSKALIYGVVQPLDPGINVSKALLYAVLQEAESSRNSDMMPFFGF